VIGGVAAREPALPGGVGERTRASAQARPGGAREEPHGMRAPAGGARRAVARRSRDGECGQALLLLLAGFAALLVGAAVLAAIASGLTGRDDQQRAADLAALGAARAMAQAYPRLFVPAAVDGHRDPAHLERAAYLALAERAATHVAARNGIRAVAVTFPDAASLAPLRVRVTVLDGLAVGGGDVHAGSRAEAELVQGAPSAPAGPPNAGEYPGPYAIRQGRPMRPDTATAFDRLSAAARRDGLDLVVVSAYRSDAEQSVLFARHPDPKWVAPPGKSLHRLGTELDLGPAAAYPWLLANAPRFHFVRRYAWEPWHFGFTLNAGSSSLGYRADGRTALPSFVPEQYAAPISRAAQRWNVSAALLAAQLWQESHFNPFAQSGAGAQGIAQFMPGTAQAYGLRDPFDAEAAIDAQAHLMRDLLRQLGSVPLALAGYNAGPAAVQRCGCIPPIPETQAYVTQILALLGGAGLDGAAAGRLEARLVA
jgi:Transglycosylase SLT domain/D-alanyl-D-alanine carboxypeptidase